MDKTDDYPIGKGKNHWRETWRKKYWFIQDFPGHDEAFCRINGEKYSFLAKGGLQITKE